MSTIRTTRLQFRDGAFMDIVQRRPYQWELNPHRRRGPKLWDMSPSPKHFQILWAMGGAI